MVHQAINRDKEKYLCFFSLSVTKKTTKNLKAQDIFLPVPRKVRN